MDPYFVSQRTLHVAVIMDGNGRWALARGLPRIAGHRAGAKAVRRVVETAPSLGIGTLTLFAFSADNWRRPAEEVGALMDLFAEFLVAEAEHCLDNGVRLEVIGRRDRLDTSVCCAISHAETLTAPADRLQLRIAVDYSGRDAILAAVEQGNSSSREAVDRWLGPPVDLLIRTGGEQRLSDFLLWESAYAELVFSRRMWPDFDSADLTGAVREFRGRERRFGAVPALSAPRESSWLD
ncbi:MAG TPA: di-trans,poly-cis-decaprenylcistransferase [Bryobacteraceae bacterium]